MNKRRLPVLVTVMVGFLYSQVGAADWGLAVGYGYMTGLGSLSDAYRDSLEGDGYITVQKSGELPVWVSVRPYLELDSGIRLDVGIGPFSMLQGDYQQQDQQGHYQHWQLPLSLTGGYTFMARSSFSPYVRGGVSYHVAGGDLFEGSSMGFLAAVGVELLRYDSFSFGLEAAYDSASVDIRNLASVDGSNYSVKVAELTFSLFILF